VQILHSKKIDNWFLEVILLQKSRVILVISHGTTDKTGIIERNNFAILLKAELECNTEICYLDSMSPYIKETINICINKHYKEIILFPLLLNRAEHLKHDIYNIVELYKKKYTDIKFYISNNLGSHQEIIEILKAKIVSIANNLEINNTGLLFVSHYNDNDDVRNDVYSISRKLHDNFMFCETTVNYYNNVKPSIDQSLSHLLNANVKNIIVLAYFLFSGIIINSLKGKILEFKITNPSIETRFSGPIGADIRVVNIIREYCDMNISF